MIKTNEPSVIKKEDVKETVTMLSGACPFPYLNSGSKGYFSDYKIFVRDPGKLVKEDDKNFEDNDKENG